MKVFISWSGDISRSVGAAFSEWLPQVSHSIKPFYSDDDIAKGTRWSQVLARELDSTAVGLLCVTAENLDSRWLNFEAGAISTALGNTPELPRVMPFLLGLRKVDVQQPLSDFQMTSYEVEDVWKMLQSINRAGGTEELDEVRLRKSFERWWPDLASELDSMLAAMGDLSPVELPSRPATTDQILEEILELAREQHRILNSEEFQITTPKMRAAIRASAREELARLAQTWLSFASVVNQHFLHETMEFSSDFRLSFVDVAKGINTTFKTFSVDVYGEKERSDTEFLIDHFYQEPSDSAGRLEEIPWDDGEPPF